MPPDSVDFLDKGQQEAMLKHMLRGRDFYRLIQTGKITQTDFDWLYLKVVFQSLVGVLTIQGADHYVEVVALMDQYKIVKRVAAVSPAEEQQVLEFVMWAYNTPVAEAYYMAQLEDFLGTARTFRELHKLKKHEWRDAGDRVQQASRSSNFSLGESHAPLLNFTMTPEVETVPTGVRPIDRRLSGGGLGIKEYGILCAYTGVGKTTLGLNFAWGAARHRKKACFATLELDEFKIRERLWSLIGRYDYDALRYGRLPQQTREECWEEAAQRVRDQGEFAQYLKVWDFSTDVCSIDTLEDWLRREISMDPHNPPKVMFVDWLLCLDEDMKKFNPAEMKTREVRHKLQAYSDRLSKQIARKYQIAVWATHQADAKAEDQEVVTTKHSAEGKSAAWKCSVFLGVGTNPEQRAQGIFTVTASKTRDGRTFSTKIRGALDQQRFEGMGDEEGDDDPTQELVELSGIESRIRGTMPPTQPAAVPPAGVQAQPLGAAGAARTPPPPPI